MYVYYFGGYLFFISYCSSQKIVYYFKYIFTKYSLISISSIEGKLFGKIEMQHFNLDISTLLTLSIVYALSKIYHSYVKIIDSEVCGSDKNSYRSSSLHSRLFVSATHL